MCCLTAAGIGGGAGRGGVTWIICDGGATGTVCCFDGLLTLLGWYGLELTGFNPRLLCAAGIDDPPTINNLIAKLIII